MSQRGLCAQGASQKNPTRWWARIGNILAITLTLIFGTAFILLAQDNLHPLDPAKTVILCVGGQERQVTTHKDTLAELLEQEQVTLNKHDKIEPALNTKIADGLTVTVYRVTYEVVKERVPVPQPTVTRWDRRMTSTPVVLDEGKPGVAVQTRCMWKKDGEIAQQWTQNHRVLTPPKPRRVVRGNQPSRAGATGRRVITVVATAYDPGPASCGRYASGHTAIGMHATKGVIAVDPRVIPLGSRVYVEGYGPAVAGDVGGAIKGRKIDVCFPTRGEALQWGRRTVQVVIMQ